MTKYTFSDLLDVMKTLRSENGCPWDREQNHNSLLKYLLEESHEYIEAVHSGDRTAMCEELGDVLLQVVFHAQVASEEEEFDIDDVIESITSKMIHRHPHVFGDKDIASSDEVLVEWEKIKKAEKEKLGQVEKKSALHGIPESSPALSYGQELQKKAAKVGFDWPDHTGALDKFKEEVEEVQQEIAKGTHDSIEDEFGDLLFSLVNLARKNGIDAEIALRRTNQKFRNRFEYVEENLPKPMQEASLDEMDVYWEMAKKANF